MEHTSDSHIGQVYVPVVNWILMVACIGLVVGFQTSARLAAAYGIAVTMTMVITTLLYMGVAIHLWNWNKAKVFAIGLPLLVIDIGFFVAQVIKIPHGGWFALLVGIAQFTMMTTWRRGRTIVAKEIQRAEIPIDSFVESLPDNETWQRVPGTAVFLFKDAGAAPPALLENMRHNKVLHDTVLLLSVNTTDHPYMPPAERAHVERCGPSIWQVVLTFGFMDEPDVPAAIAALAESRPEMKITLGDVTYFLGRETVLATPVRNMHPLREQIFVFQNRTAASAARFFRLPSKAVYEVGTTIEI
ncbi:MAG: KUP/HAK/KT family potassium transporter [Ilumatobacteraceae bacterium]